MNIKRLVKILDSETNKIVGVSMFTDSISNESDKQYTERNSVSLVKYKYYERLKDFVTNNKVKIVSNTNVESVKGTPFIFINESYISELLALLIELINIAEINKNEHLKILDIKIIEYNSYNIKELKTPYWIR